MRSFDVQAVEIHAPFDLVFDYVANPANLPEWTQAFTSVDGRRATMRTPGGIVEVELLATASAVSGTIDWTMTFPDGQVARAWSRAIRHGSDVIYAFVLPAPASSLEQLEGTLTQQSKQLASELAVLTRVLEQRADRAGNVVS